MNESKKLVDVLARELSEWPSGVDAIEQSDLSCTLFEFQGATLSIEVSERSVDSYGAKVTRAEWQAARDALKGAHRTDKSSTPEGATHYSEGVENVYWPAYWKEAKGGCWCYALDGRDDPEWTYHECVELPRRAKLIIPIAWNGEGLPPVGVDAQLKTESKFTEGTRLESFPAGTPVYVGGHANFGGHDLAVIIVKGRHFCGTIIPEMLKPIRTAEQIEAEERQKEEIAIQIDMQNRAWAALGEIDSPPPTMEQVSCIAKALIKANYRKQVAQ